MEIILGLFASLGLMILDCIEGFVPFCSKTLFTIRENDPAVINFLNILKDSLIVYLQGYNLFFTLQFVLYWFPNVNPFIQPFYIVRVVTNPFLEFVRKRLPPLFGFDLSFLVCSSILTYSINFLTKFKF